MLLRSNRLCALAGGLGFSFALLGSTPGQLSIHAINVGWGSSVLVEGPTGKHMLLDSGNVGEGTAAVAPYLKAEGVTSLDVIVLSHNHQDHSGGLSEVASAGFTAPVNYFNGSTGGSSTALTWESNVHATAITPGTVIDLGGGATATCIAANGRVIGQTTNYSGGDENDNSVALLIQFGGFKYIWEGDLGGAADAEDTCSGRTTSQVDVEVPMIRAILPGGSHPLIPSQSVDVIHVGHHGSMSSTHPVYVNLTSPSVALINTGHGQSGTWALPYKATVDNVLLGGAGGCAGVAAPLVLQTEDGDVNYENKMSTDGYAVNNIKVRTDGSHFWVSCNDDNGVVPYIYAGAPSVTARRASAGIPLGTEREFTVHGGGSTGGNTVTASVSTPSGNVTLNTGVSQAFAGSATDSSSSATLSYSWAFGDGSSAASASTSHAYSAAGTYTATFTATDNTGASGSATRTITVTPATGNKVTASIGTPSGNVTLASGASQAFAGSATDSGSGASLSYSWAFGDGGTATGASASHTYTNTGSSAVAYTATFTAKDQTGASGSATRTITVSPASTGGSSTYTEVEPNNTQATADLVGDNVTSIVGYFPSASDNDDYFTINLLAGHTLTVDMVGPTASSQDYDLYLYSSAGTQLASSTNAGTTEHISYKNTNVSATKVLTIRVNRYSSYSSKTPYTLTLSR